MKTLVLCLKRIALGCLMCVTVNAVVAQEVQIQHEVHRGETLESIAEHYGITVEMIKEANPKMGDFAFTGMKLNIPNDGKKVANHSAESEKTVPAKKTVDIDNETVGYAENKSVNVGLKSKDVKGNADTEGNLYYIGVKGGWGVGLSYNGDSSFPVGLGFGYLFYETGEVFSSNGGYFFHVDYTQAFWLDAKETIYIRPVLGLGYGMIEGKGKHGYESYNYKVNGMMANIHPQMGLKLWTTAKGNAVCLSVGYLYQALKFKFEGDGCFTAGLSFAF